MAVGRKKPEGVFGRDSVAALAGAVAITILAFILLSQFPLLRELGYPGIFLISLISSATVLLPMPGFAVVFAMGAYLNPFLVGIAAGLGSGLGETTGYLAGYAGHGAIERTKIYREHEKQIRRFGPPAIFVLAFIPNPAFDIAGMVSGAVKMPYWQFLVAAILGKTVRYVALAYVGGAAAGWLA